MDRTGLTFGHLRCLWNLQNLFHSQGERRTENFICFVGVAELLGAVGIVFSMLTSILPWLTPLAAIELILIQGFAIFTEHLPKKEFKMLPLNIYFAAMSIFVIIGRLSLLASSFLVIKNAT